MEITTEAERKRTFVESKEPSYLAQPDAQRLTASFADPAEIDLVFAAPADARAAEVERQNRAATQKGDDLGRERQAQIAETSTRIDITGMGKQTRERRIAQEKARADSSTRYQQLLALQAQLDALDHEIELLDGSINKILALHLLPEEMRYLDGLSQEERYQEEMRLMREKLESGEVTHAEFDEFRDFWDARAQKVETRNDVKDKFDALLPDDVTPGEKIRITEDLREQLAAEVQKQGAAVAEAAAEHLDAPKREVVDAAAGESWHEGNATKIDDGNAFAKAFGGLGDSPATSFANDAAPETPLRESAPALQTEFETKAKQETDVKPDAKVDLTVKPNPEDTPPSQGM